MGMEGEGGGEGLPFNVCEDLTPVPTGVKYSRLTGISRLRIEKLKIGHKSPLECTIFHIKICTFGVHRGFGRSPSVVKY